MITRRSFLHQSAAAALSPAARLFGAARKKPNIVFILADDLGWSDTSLYGSRYYKTPNIDRLATRGMMFTQAYAASPMCSPTRASLMTGLYPARIGITAAVCHVPQVITEETLVKKNPPALKALQAVSATRLKQEYFTVAEALKQAGYATGHFGKWHLGAEPYDPLHQGFDIDIPHTPLPGPVNGYLAPWKAWPSQGKPGEHLEDRMAEEAERFIQTNKDRPFYLNYWAFSVHTPWQAKKDLIDQYAAKANPFDRQHNPVYAAMVQSLDEAVGRLVRAIDQAGVADNTLIVFFSDNGGVTWSSAQEPAMRHPEYQNIPATSNLPLRSGKGSLYEGGTREPCVVVWPGKVKPASRSEEIISSVDFYPTLLDITGARAEAGQRFDGISILPALEGKSLGREALFCHFPHYIRWTSTSPGTWVRKGDWKLIRFFCDNDDQTDRFELYNLRNDIGEQTNLAEKEPARVREMNALIEAFLRDTHAVVPRANPAYKR